MKPIALPVVREILFGTPAVVELLEFYVTGGAEPDLLFAMYDRQLVFAGRTYIGAGFKAPVKIRESVADQIGELRLVLPNLSAAISTLLTAADVAGSRCVVRQVLLARLSLGESVVVYDGRIKSPVGIERTSIVLSVEPGTTDAGGLLVMPRRTYSRQCENRFGDPDTCAVDRGLYTYSGVAAAPTTDLVIHDPGLTQTVIDALKTADANGDLSFLPAEVVFDQGNNYNQSRPVEDLAPCRIVLRRPFYSYPRPGEAYRLRRLCGKGAGNCAGYNNTDRFGGHPNIPKKPLNLEREILH